MNQIQKTSHHHLTLTLKLQLQKEKKIELKIQGIIERNKIQGKID